MPSRCSIRSSPPDPAEVVLIRPRRELIEERHPHRGTDRTVQRVFRIRPDARSVVLVLRLFWVPLSLQAVCGRCSEAGPLLFRRLPACRAQAQRSLSAWSSVLRSFRLASYSAFSSFSSISGSAVPSAGCAASPGRIPPSGLPVSAGAPAGDASGLRGCRLPGRKRLAALPRWAGPDHPRFRPGRRQQCPMPGRQR
jgi:hypothetical protein